MLGILVVPWIAYLFFAAVVWVLVHWQEQSLRVTSIRFDGERVELWQDEDYSLWLWCGEGRLSHAFVEWTLISDSMQRYQFRLWRDSVSEPSWRAINMAYRVNCSHARQQATRQATPEG